MLQSYVVLLFYLLIACAILSTELTEIFFRGCIMHPFKTMLLDAYYKLTAEQQ